MNQLSPELTRQVLHPAMHQKLLLRAAELVELGWIRGTAARDAEGQKVRSTAPQATAWCVVGAMDRALYELFNLDVYDLLGLDADAYDTTPCLLDLLNELRRPLQRVLGRSGLAHWNDHVCPGPAAAEQLLREAAAWIGPGPGPVADHPIAVNPLSHRVPARSGSGVSTRWRGSRRPPESTR